MFIEYVHWMSKKLANKWVGPTYLEVRFPTGHQSVHLDGVLEFVNLSCTEAKLLIIKLQLRSHRTMFIEALIIF